MLDPWRRLFRQKQQVEVYMTDFYFEIEVKGDPAISGHIFAKLISVLHAIYKEHGASPIGVNFPYWQDHNRPNLATIGKVIRFFGDKGNLTYFSRNPILLDIIENAEVKCSRILPTPGDATFVITRRNRALEKYIRNKWPISRYLPYIKYKSKTSGSRFSLFIEMNHSPIETKGLFSTYGLSKGNVTVPYF